MGSERPRGSGSKTSHCILRRAQREHPHKFWWASFGSAQGEARQTQSRPRSFCRCPGTGNPISRMRPGTRKTPRISLKAFPFGRQSGPRTPPNRGPKGTRRIPVLWALASHVHVAERGVVAEARGRPPAVVGHPHDLPAPEPEEKRVLWLNKNECRKLMARNDMSLNLH